MACNLRYRCRKCRAWVSRRGIASFIYRWFIWRDLGSDPGFMRSILGIETPGLLIKWLFYEGFPNAVEGGIAGYLPILTAKAICGPYSLMTAAYATATLYAGVFIALMALGFAAAGFHSGIVAATFQLLGVLAGLFVAAQEFDETPPTPGAQKAPSL